MFVEIMSSPEGVVMGMTTPAAAPGAELAFLPVLSACCPPAAAAMPDEAAATLAALFKALADPARVKIVSMLLNADEVCACDVATAIGKSAATTSHHLRLLRTAGLVAGDRRGTWIYYRVQPERIAQLREALRLPSPA
jgi:ArsR family transcriptional regulator